MIAPPFPRFFRFYALARPHRRDRAHDVGWYWQEVTPYGYDKGRPVGPFGTYDAAFLAAGEEESAAPRSSVSRAA